LLAPQVAASLRSAAEAAAPAAGEAAPEVAQLRDEMRVIKSLLERQLAGFAWGEMARDTPTRALLLGEMIEAGFSGQLARKLVQDMPEDMAPDDGRKWLKAAVNRRLRTLPTEADFIDRGGVYAIVGPTGVGKTTTTAKLAARCVVRYGADRLALLTTDGYRIGAQEQLRIYGRILGVPVFVVRDGEDLRRTLADLRDKHMVLIDTVGMSQRDRMVAEQAAMLMRSGEVNRLLLLNAGCRGDTLDDVVRAYAGEDLAGCIMTKVDEATALAPALDCIVRHGLTLSYVANGQRVPEDLHLPNRNYLLHRAFKTGATRIGAQPARRGSFPGDGAEQLDGGGSLLCLNATQALGRRPGRGFAPPVRCAGAAGDRLRFRPRVLRPHHPAGTDRRGAGRVPGTRW
jgi:flagellar biosynthesis protein FlhF